MNIIMFIESLRNKNLKENLKKEREKEKLRKERKLQYKKNE